jgi:hypothetical protein
MASGEQDYSQRIVGNVTATVASFTPQIIASVVNPGTPFGMFRLGRTQAMLCGGQRILSPILPPNATGLISIADYNTASSTYVTIIDDDYILPAVVRKVSGHAFIRLPCNLWRGAGTGVANQTVTTQVAKYTLAGVRTLLGTSFTDQVYNITYTAPTGQQCYWGLPYVDDTDLTASERLGIRLLVQMKTTGTSKAYYRHIYSTNIWGSYAYLPL